MSNGLGMMVRRWATALLVAGMGFAGSASAAVLLVDGNGVLTGANGVDVGGTLYNVRFVDGTCAGVFSACEDAQFDLSTAAGANAAALALLDQVFIDGVSGNFDSNASTTLGCVGIPPDGLPCTVLTPWIVDTTSGGIRLGVAVQATTNAPASGDTVELVSFPELQDTSIDPFSDPRLVWARWTVQTVAVPEPSAFALLGVGLLALGLARHRRKKA